MAEITATNQFIHHTARLAPSVKIKCKTLHIGANAIIRENTTIDGGEIFIDSGVDIGFRVIIATERLHLGYKTQISSNCQLRGLGRWADNLQWGDFCFLGEACNILLPVLIAGDYVVTHNHLLANGYKPCYIGHNTWIGQNCILNSNETLTIGNGVGIGAYSSIYTHAFFGELLEGCQIFNVAPVIIEDNAWIVGGYNVISPGVTIGERSMILTSSVVSKNVPALHCVGGVPARDVTDKITPFRTLSLEEKYTMMEKFIKEYVEDTYPGEYERIASGYRVAPKDSEPFRVLLLETIHEGDTTGKDATLLYVKTYQGEDLLSNITVFDLSTKQYTKRRSDPEYRIIKFMNNSRARFVPNANPRIGPDVKEEAGKGL